ncbi:MAG: hypothetical protein OXL96_28220 [Candidatus Poribacteria bacterium]|nr:hypothetical protein [Candidatus Poribacteria bacterium]
MPTASLSLTDTTYDSISNNPFRIVMSELLSAFTTSAVVISGQTAYLNYSYQTGNDYIFTFGTATAVGEAGYVRIQIPATAATPNLDEDYDWTIYWGTDGVIHFGDTDAVRSSRLTSTLNTVRWGSSSVRAGTTTPIYFDFSVDTYDFANTDITLGGDISAIGALARPTFQRYFGHITMPSDLGDGGSFTIQIGLEDVYPGLSASEEWTLSWDASGRTSAIRTADIPIAITASLDRDYVAVGEEMILTLDYHKDGAAVAVSDISVIDGMTVTALPSTNNRQYRYILTAPPTGKGTGVVSIPADVIQPGNNSVSIQFTYIDSITPTLELSTRRIENSGVVDAILNFDYDVPIFESSVLNLGVSFSQLAIGGVGLGIGGVPLGIRSGSNATAGEAVALDDRHRRWSVPVTVPDSGEGELEIMLPEDAIGSLQHEAVMAPVFYAPQRAPSIRLNIPIRQGSTLLWIFGRATSHTFNIIGNNISIAYIHGELAGLDQSWNPSTGILTLSGTLRKYLKNERYFIQARDNSGQTSISFFITTIDIRPRITVPGNRFDLRSNQYNEWNVSISNNPTEVEVEGLLAGLSFEKTDTGVKIFGTLGPRSQYKAGDPNLEIFARFNIDARNAGGQTARNFPTVWIS